jgi:hypothetical protein
MYITKKATLSIFIFFLTATLITVSSCKKATEEDKVLYDKVKSDVGFTFYKNSTAVLTSSSTSPHNDFFRMRYNDIAIAAMTDNGKLPVGGTFPDGSLVVKELYDTQGGALKLLAVMGKSGSGSTGAGWKWAEYKPDGSAVYSVTKKGDGCISCHSTNARDYNAVFYYFP